MLIILCLPPPISPTPPRPTLCPTLSCSEPWSIDLFGFRHLSSLVLWLPMGPAEAWHQGRKKSRKRDMGISSPSFLPPLVPQPCSSWRTALPTWLMALTGVLPTFFSLTLGTSGSESFKFCSPWVSLYTCFLESAHIFVNSPFNKLFSVNCSK